MKASTRQVLDFLRLRGRDGATEAEIQSATAIRSGAQRIHELIHLHGIEVDKVMERSPIGARYARWFVREPRPVPTTGQQLSLMEAR